MSGPARRRRPDQGYSEIPAAALQDLMSTALQQPCNSPALQDQRCTSSAAGPDVNWRNTAPAQANHLRYRLKETRVTAWHGKASAPIYPLLGATGAVMHATECRLSFTSLDDK
jgi:hypothetical protein